MEKSYIELLRDPRWQRKRLEVMQRDDFTCIECGAKDRTLNVHHRRYERGRLPWEYDGADLTTLCEPCHEWVTASRKRARTLLDSLGLERLELAVGFLAGLAAQDQSDRDVVAIENGAQLEGLGLSAGVSVRQLLNLNYGGGGYVVQDVQTLRLDQVDVLHERWVDGQMDLEAILP